MRHVEFLLSPEYSTILEETRLVTSHALIVLKTLFRSLNTFQNSDLRPEENILQICVEMKNHRRNLKDFAS